MSKNNDINIVIDYTSIIDTPILLNY